MIGSSKRQSGRSLSVRACFPSGSFRSLGHGVLALAALTLASAGGVSPAFGAASERHPDRFDVVVVDAGHGGEDDGARGPGGLAEKELVLDVSRRVARGLAASGVRVVLTRDDDTFVPLEGRTSLANDARADLFISIHANSARNRKPEGIETYFASLEASDANAQQVATRENEAFGDAGRGPGISDPLTALLGDMIATEHSHDSSTFAKLAQGELSALDVSPSRGVKQAPFVVLMGVQMPAALIEIGFVSNPGEEKRLRAKRYRESLSKAIIRAVQEFGRRSDAKRGVDRAASLFEPSR